MGDGEKDWKKYSSHMKNNGVTKLRLGKLRTMFNLVQRNLSIRLPKAKEKNLRSFITRLNDNEITRLNGSPLSGSTKADAKKFLRQYFKWLRGKDQVYPEEVAWIKTKIPKDELPEERDIVSIAQAVELANVVRSTHYRALTLILFDSGFRISEALSVKKRDLKWDTYDEAKNCWWIRCNKSKTFCRNVPIPLFTDEITAFTETEYFKFLSDDDLIWSKGKGSYRKILRRAQEKIFPDITLTPHCLRHSSATHYAGPVGLDVIPLMQRYGWAKPEQAMTYIRLSGRFMKQAPKRVMDDEVAKLREENKALKSKMTEFEKELKQISPILTKLLKKRSMKS